MWKWETEHQPKAVVVILHSAYEQHRWYAWLIEKFRSARFHVVMGDLPGHGEQGKYARYHDENFEEYYNYTKVLLKVALEYNLPLFIVGNGLGASIAAYVLQKNKIECAGVVLTSPWLHFKLAPGKLSNALSSFSAITSNVKLKHELSIQYFTRNTDVLMELKEQLPLNSMVTVKWYREWQQMTRIIRDPENKFPDIPLLLMTGENDKITDISTSKKWMMEQKLSEFHYKQWNGCLHSLFFEVEREEVFRYTIDFINNVLRDLGYIVE
ncbi:MULTISPECIES: alpha/beta hydrolase [Solibacillus]|uniref:Alpha/beta hydrolase n=1 Tax=Solibacillus merdavium TaxID=2762218 RepID=A0ABR8XS08_9BACL|nr:alpha/beta hydrolase [Solibacillus merdavium]MBD8034724.1 alpha/beta hydrolase [Solibacillus merdavium]